MSTLILIWVIEVFWVYDSTFNMTTAHFWYVWLALSKASGKKPVSDFKMVYLKQQDCWNDNTYISVFLCSVLTASLPL